MQDDVIPAWRRSDDTKRPCAIRYMEQIFSTKFAPFPRRASLNTRKKKRWSESNSAAEKSRLCRAAAAPRVTKRSLRNSHDDTQSTAKDRQSGMHLTSLPLHGVCWYTEIHIVNFDTCGKFWMCNWQTVPVRNLWNLNRYYTDTTHCPWSESFETSSEIPPRLVRSVHRQIGSTT